MRLYQIFVVRKKGCCTNVTTDNVVTKERKKVCDGGFWLLCIQGLYLFSELAGCCVCVCDLFWDKDLICMERQPPQIVTDAGRAFALVSLIPWPGETNIISS